jgi:hypothetical protein
MTDDRSGEYSVKKAFSAESATNGCWGLASRWFLKLIRSVPPCLARLQRFAPQLGSAFQILTFASLREIFWSSIRVNSRSFFVLFAPFCGYYVFLAPLNMPVSVIRFAIDYRLCA